jgi:SAM-dependent methyltransferase
MLMSAGKDDERPARINLLKGPCGGGTGKGGLLMRLESDLLRCPVCKGSLSERDDGWLCSSCGIDYQPCEGFPDLVSPHVSDLKRSERSHYTDLIDFFVSTHEKWKDSPFYNYVHERFLNDLRTLPAGSLILEVGAGIGTDGLKVLRSGYRLVERDHGFGDSCAHLLADAEELPFADDAFDGAFMVACLHHLPEPLSCLREIRRVVKPGGILVLGTELNSWQHKTIFPVGKRVIQFIYRMLGKGGYKAETVSEADDLTEGFSAGDLRAMLEAAGFSRFELKPAGYLAAATVFFELEISGHLGRPIRMYPLESAAIKVDSYLERINFLAPYPWHWNAVAYV